MTAASGVKTRNFAPISGPTSSHHEMRHIGADQLLIIIILDFA